MDFLLCVCVCVCVCVFLPEFPDFCRKKNPEKVLCNGALVFIEFCSICYILHIPRLCSTGPILGETQTVNFKEIYYTQKWQKNSYFSYENVRLALIPLWIDAE